jgi:hypothetical protein
MMAWASASLNLEHGSILAAGDWGLISALEAGAGVGELAPPLDDGPLQEQSKKQINIALIMIDLFEFGPILPPEKLPILNDFLIGICSPFLRSSLDPISGWPGSLSSGVHHSSEVTLVYGVVGKWAEIGV